MLGAGDRVRRHEMRKRRQIRGHVLDHRTFDRADIGDDRARLEMGCDLLRDRAAGADRNAEDDEVGVLDGFRIGLGHGIDNAEFGDPRAGLRRSLGGNDLARQSLLAGGARDRAADQAEADQRELVELRRRAHVPAMKSRKPSTTRRLASSVPMVMRSAWGRR